MNTADLSEPKTRKRLTSTAIKGFLRIIGYWQLSEENARSLLGGIPREAYQNLSTSKIRTLSLSEDTLTRISLLVGIYKALNILYSKKLADAWIMRPNSGTMFCGRTPFSYMAQGDIASMKSVRQLLDAECMR